MVVKSATFVVWYRGFSEIIYDIALLLIVIPIIPLALKTHVEIGLAISNPIFIPSASGSTNWMSLFNAKLLAFAFLIFIPFYDRTRENAWRFILVFLILYVLITQDASLKESGKALIEEAKRKELGLPISPRPIQNDEISLFYGLITYITMVLFLSGFIRLLFSAPFLLSKYFRSTTDWSIPLFQGGSAMRYNILYVLLSTIMMFIFVSFIAIFSVLLFLIGSHIVFLSSNFLLKEVGIIAAPLIWLMIPFHFILIKYVGIPVGSYIPFLSLNFLASYRNLLLIIITCLAVGSVARFIFLQNPAQETLWLYKWGSYFIVLGPPAIYIFHVWRRTFFDGLRQGMRNVLQSQRRTASQIVKDTKQAPILYLRSFLDDEEAKVRAEGWLFRLMFGLGDRQRYLEEVVADEAFRFAPVVALSNPKIAVQPLGAARDVAEDNNWQEIVIDYINKSQRIILTLGKTANLAWEIDKIIELGKLEICVLVLPKSYGFDRRISSVSNNLAIKLGLSSLEEEASLLRNARIIYFDRSAKKFIAFRAKQSHSRAYRLLTRLAIKLGPR